MDERIVELSVEQKGAPGVILSGIGMEQMETELQGMFDRLRPRHSQKRQVTVKDARRILLEQETDALIDRQAVSEKAVELVENQGIIFLDELDKVCGPSSGQGPDVSRQGVQRDLLPVVEGTTVNTRYGPVRTDYILFIAAGAFHTSSPSDLMPELQGRFPIRVELSDLKREDFLRILTEPKHALTKQYSALLAIEGVTLEYTPDGVEELADFAFKVNQEGQDIGARRLHTILERLVEDVSFEGPDLETKRVVIDGEYVRQRLEGLRKEEGRKRFGFIL
jgi:ATP-dependent HslUV protease ATP-binding subunit HslU